MTWYYGLTLVCSLYAICVWVKKVRRKKPTDYDYYYRHKDGHRSEPPF